MSTGIILLIVGVLYFTAQALALSFKFTKVPDILILVITGIVIGPMFKIVMPQDFGSMGSVMTIIALAIILFESGTSLKLSTMGKSISSTLMITFITVILTIIILAIGSVAFLSGNWMLAFLTGVILCGTSSAVVIPMVQSLKLGEKTSTILILESAFTDVICIVITFALIDTIKSGEVGFLDIASQVIKSLGFAALLGVLGGFFWLKVWHKVREIPTSIFTTLAFAFVLYGIAEILNVSGAITTLMFGITLANLPVFFKKTLFPTISDAEKLFYQEIVFLLKSFFFIFLGVSMHFSNLYVIAISIVQVSLLYFLRIWVTRFSLSQDGVSLRDAKVASVMIPKGLAPAVLVSLVIQKEIPHIVFTAALVPISLGGPLKNFYSLTLRKFNDQ
ncbi:MAG: hypothetical protein A2Z20_00130 [Bdellovibrionales bacterium RBG_16_40_8]|nr:MAG: hypothetical protein A2Z20_00130 [Bdellovibrionales bacterium RBG_16_40_8]